MEPLNHTLANFFSQSDNALANGYYDQALQHLKEALTYTRNTNDKLGEAAVTRKLGKLYVQKQDLNEACRYYTRTRYLLNQIAGNEYAVADLYSIIGDIFRKQNNLPKAESNYRDALRRFEQAGATRDKFRLERKLARVLGEQQRKEEASAYYKGVLKFFEKEEDYKKMAALFNDLGNLYTEEEELAQAFAYYKQAYDQLEKIQDKDKDKNIEYNKIKAKTLYNMGIMYFRHQKNLAQAENYLSRARDVYRTTRLNKAFYMQEVKTLFQLGDIGERDEDWESAIGYYKEAWIKIKRDRSSMAEGEKQEFNGLVLLHLGRCYRKLNNISEALPYLVEAQMIFREIGSSQYEHVEEQIGKIRHELGSVSFASALTLAKQEVNKRR